MTDDPRERQQGLLIEEEMQESYLSYAMSVIVSRALPDVRDGLKPSQRRVLVAMNDLNLGPRSKYRKCAKIAGDTSGNYHPHGESVVYPTLVRMAQHFSMRYPLVQGQGNFGSIDGDPPAAMRYTEARMTQSSSDMMVDLEKDTVDFIPNYDDSRTEPSILPSKFPNLLCNGSSGIAVGMATSIPPHNVNEICNGLRLLLDKPEAEIDELMQLITGPDFPTGALICGRKGIVDAYKTGRGHLTLRARVEVEEYKSGRKAIVVHELPYQVNKTTLIEAIANAVKDGRILGVSDIRDESDKDGIRLVIELKKGEDEYVTLNQLYKYSQLETTFSIINIALVGAKGEQGGRPQTLSLKEMLQAYIDHRREIIRRRTKFLLAKAEHRLHINEGLRIAVDNIDEVIRIIRGSANTDEARHRLIERFDFSEIQANAILQMQLQRLTGLEREKLEEERKKLTEEIAGYRAILASTRLVDDLIRGDLDEVVERYGDARRSEITAPVSAVEDEDLIPDDAMAVTISHQGYLKRLALDTYRTQGRGGKGVTGGGSKDEDFLEHLFVAQNHDYILFFTDRGRVHWLKVYRIPELSRQSRGRSVMNLLQLEKGEKITSMIPVRDFDHGYLFMATSAGVVKRTALKAFSRPKRTGIIAVGLAEDDRLVGVAVVSQGDDVVLATSAGYAIRFPVSAVRPMGRTARGVNGIKPRDEDFVVGLVVVDPAAQLLTVGERGVGKRTAFDEYRITNRGGKGIINIKVSEKTGPVVAVKAVVDGDDLMMMTEGSMVVRIAVDSISSLGRSTQGVRMISVKKADKLVSVATVVSDDTEGEAPRALIDEPEAEVEPIDDEDIPDDDDPSDEDPTDDDSSDDDSSDDDDPAE